MHALLSRTEVETATLQERVGIVEKSGAQSRDASERITTQSADEKLKAAQAVVKKDEATYNAAKKLESDVAKLPLKTLLSRANEILAPPHKNR